MQYVKCRKLCHNRGVRLDFDVLTHYIMSNY